MPCSKPDHVALPLPVRDRRPRVIRADNVGSVWRRGNWRRSLGRRSGGAAVWSRKASTEPHSTNQAAPATRRPAGGSFHREFHAPAGLAGDKADIPAVARPDKESEPVGLTARTPADQPDLGSASLSTFQAKIDAITAALPRV
jgi:hypothetical protein